MNKARSAPNNSIFTHAKGTKIDALKIHGSSLTTLQVLEDGILIDRKRLRCVILLCFG